MSIELKNLPSLIAIPYSETLKKDSIQRKDFQRITLENALSLNAVISLSNYFDQNRPSEEDTKKEKFPELKNFDLGQISVGTWNMFSRETTRAMGANAKALFLNNIHDLYHGSKSKEWDEVSGALITIRNKDAHGELIPADKLGAELDKRQVILDKLIEMLDFLKDYKIVVPINTELINGKMSYNCKNFTGINPESISISNSQDELELFNVYLYHNSGKVLNISPMFVVYADKNNPQDYQLYLYSKTSNKSKGNLHYLSLTSSLDLLSDDKEALGKLKTPAEICENFAFFRIFIEDKSLHDQKKPAISIERKLKSDFVSEEDLIEIELKIKNSGEVSADDISVSFNFPDIFKLTDSDGEVLKKQSFNELIESNLSLDSGEEYKLKLYFKADDSGQYEFPPITLEYSYEDFQGKVIKPKVEKDGSLINIETAPALYCTIYDPADPYSLSPVINVDVIGEFGLDAKGMPKKAPYIGEKIKVDVILANKGFGIAKDIDLTVMTPKEMRLISGNPQWSGNINPNQTTTKSYEFECVEPGIQSVSVREIIYADKDGNLFKTPGGAFNLLVRNEPRVKYKRFMEEIWDDLAIDEDELQELQVLNKKYKEFIPEDEIKQIELQTKLKIILNTFREHFEKKGISIIERPVRDGVLALAYKSSNCIYAVIDYSENNSLKIYIKGNLKGQFEAQKYDFKENKKSGLKLFTQFFNQVGLNYSENIGYEIFQGKINNLKGIIGRTGNWIETHDYLQHSLKENIAKALGIPSDRITNPTQNAQVVGYYINNAAGERDRISAIDWYGAYFDEQDNLNLVGQPTNIENMEDLTKLKEKGYAIKKWVGYDLPVYEDIEKIGKKGYYGIQVFKGRVKNAEEVKKQITDNLQKLQLELVKIQNEQAIAQIQASEMAKDVIDTINEINIHINQISNEMAKKGLAKSTLFSVNKLESNEAQLIYYTIKDFPLFQPEQDIFRIIAKKKKFEIAFRNISDELLDKYQENIDNNLKIDKNWYKFIISDNSNMEMIKEFIEYAMHNSGQYAYLPNYHLLKAFVENNWSGGLGYILEGLMINNFDSDYELIAQHIIKTNPDWRTPTSSEIKVYVRRFKTFSKIFGIAFIYEDNFTERLIAKPEMRDIITKVPKRKKEIEYSDIELASANLKRIISFLNSKNEDWWQFSLTWSGYHWNKMIVLWSFYPKTATRYLISDTKAIIDIRTGVSKETQPIIDKILSLKGTIDILGDLKVIFNDDLSKLGKYGRAWENPSLVTFESNNTFKSLEDFTDPKKIQKIVDEFNLIHDIFFPDEYKKEVFCENYDPEEYNTAIKNWEESFLVNFNNTDANNTEISNETNEEQTEQE